MKKVSALVGAIALTLLMSSAWAQQMSGDYELTVPGGEQPVLGVVLKSQRDCPTGTTFFKNQFPSLTNGQGGGSKTETFSIDNDDVTMTVTWLEDNSFEFDIVNGVVHAYKVGVNVDTINLLYNYVNSPVRADTLLNKLTEDPAAADVNHLDLCLGPFTPDIVPPVIAFISPLDGTSVSGTVTVTVTVTDPSGVDPLSVTVSVNDGLPVAMNCTDTGQPPNQTDYECSYEWDTEPLLAGDHTVTVSATDAVSNTSTQTVIVLVDNEAPDVTINSPEDTTPPKQVPEVPGEVSVVATVTDDNLDVNSVTAIVYPDSDASSASNLMLVSTIGDVYTWTWDTGPLPGGLYTIEVSAADTLGNTTEPPASVTVEVVKFFTHCFGTLGDEDFDPNDPTEPDYAGGCKPTDLARVQTPPDTEACGGDNPPIFCFLAGTLLKPANGTAHCGDYGFPDPRMKLVDDLDPRCSDPAGCWVPDVIRELRFFDPLENIGIDPLLVPRVVDSLPPNSMLADAVVLDENTYCANGCCAIAQHVKGYANNGAEGDELQVLYPVWPQNPATGLIFIKTHFPEEVLDPALVCECYDEIDNPDLQKACGAGYSPLDQQLDDYGFLSVLTQECVNPARTLTRNNGFDVSNVVEAAGINFDTDPVAVLNFKYGLSEDQFGLVFAALDCAAPLLLTGKFSDVSSPVNQAKRRFGNFNPRSLQRSIDALKDAADAIRTQTTWLVTERNCPGEALGRIEHLIWDLGLLKRELERLEGLGVL